MQSYQSRALNVTADHPLKMHRTASMLSMQNFDRVIFQAIYHRTTTACTLHSGQLFNKVLLHRQIYSIDRSILCFMKLSIPTPTQVYARAKIFAARGVRGKSASEEEETNVCRQQVPL